VPRRGDGYVVVVGGANTDIAGFTERPLVQRDSNPGHVRVSAGGVGRNIAENLARLGVPTYLVAAFGEGHDARALVEACREAGVDVVEVPAPGVPASRYLAILDDAGDLALAVNDMRATESLTSEALDAHAPLLAGAAAIVLDANLAAEALGSLAGRFADVPLVLDCVSVPKVSRARSILGALWAVKANMAEAQALSGEDAASPLEAAHGCVRAGAARAFVTAGPDGAGWVTPEGEGTFTPPPLDVVNATGAGDAFTAGLVYALLAGLDARQAALFGSAMSRLALGSEQTVSPEISEERALQTMETML
jgi:pseudouridine kinase